MADPGFFRQGVPTYRRGGVPTYYFGIFLLKIAWNWKKLKRGRARLTPPWIHQWIYRYSNWSLTKKEFGPRGGGVQPWRPLGSYRYSNHSIWTEEGACTPDAPLNSKDKATIVIDRWFWKIPKKLSKGTCILDAPFRSANINIYSN